ETLSPELLSSLKPEGNFAELDEEEDDDDFFDDDFELVDESVDSSVLVDAFSFLPLSRVATTMPMIGPLPRPDLAGAPGGPGGGPPGAPSGAPSGGGPVGTPDGGPVGGPVGGPKGAPPTGCVGGIGAPNCCVASAPAACSGGYHFPSDACHQPSPWD